MTWVDVAGKLGRVVLAAWVVAMVAWSCSELGSESAAKRAARAAGVLPADDAALTAELRRELIDDTARRRGLDRSLPARLAGYTVDLFELDFGRSWRSNQTIGPRLRRATWTTARLLLLSLLVAVVLGWAAAVMSARRPGGGLDTALAVAAAVALSAPPVWLAILGLQQFGWGGVSTAVLPVVVLALVPAFVIARHGRAALLEASQAPWAVATLARGVSRDRLLAVHAARASLATMAPLLTVLVAYLLGATVVIEELFGIAGLGQMLVHASRYGDTPVIVAVSVVCTLIVATTSASLDLLRRRLAPNEVE